MVWVSVDSLPMPPKPTREDRRFHRALLTIGKPVGWSPDPPGPATGDRALVAEDGRIYRAYKDGYVWVDPRRVETIRLKQEPGAIQDQYDRTTHWRGGGLSIEARSDGWSLWLDIYFVDRKRPLYGQDRLILGDTDTRVGDVDGLTLFWADRATEEANQTFVSR